MRTPIMIVTLFALISQSGVAFAQQGTQGALVEATPIEKVLDANPEPDGKAYRIDLLLSKGARVGYKIPPSEAAKIIDGLSKSAIAGGQSQKVATIVSGMSIEMRCKGKAVILTPRSESAVLERLAIPRRGAERRVEVHKTRIAQDKVTAGKQPKQQKQP